MANPAYSTATGNPLYRVKGGEACPMAGCCCCECPEDVEDAYNLLLTGDEIYSDEFPDLGVRWETQTIQLDRSTNPEFPCFFDSRDNFVGEITFDGGETWAPFGPGGGAANWWYMELNEDCEWHIQNAIYDLNGYDNVVEDGPTGTYDDGSVVSEIP